MAIGPTTLSTTLDKGGAGFVIRDFMGNLLVTRSTVFMTTSVPLAQVIGALSGLYRAVMELGIKRIWLEGNLMIQWIDVREIEEWLCSSLFGIELIEQFNYSLVIRKKYGNRLYNLYMF